MGRHSCCYKQKLRKGLWSPEEDEKLSRHITQYGHGCWSSVPKLAGLQRCGKSCRLRWINYLRPDLKRGAFSQEEENLIIELHSALGNRWSQIAARLPGRTDNEIKNLWNSCLKKKLRQKGIDPNTHKPLSEVADQADDKAPKLTSGKSPQMMSSMSKQLGRMPSQYTKTTTKTNPTKTAHCSSCTTSSFALERYSRPTPINPHYLSNNIDSRNNHNTNANVNVNVNVNENLSSAHEFFSNHFSFHQQPTYGLNNNIGLSKGPDTSLSFTSISRSSSDHHHHIVADQTFNSASLLPSTSTIPFVSSSSTISKTPTQIKHSSISSTFGSDISIGSYGPPSSGFQSLEQATILGNNNTTTNSHESSNNITDLQSSNSFYESFSWSVADHCEKPADTKWSEYLQTPLLSIGSSSAAGLQSECPCGQTPSCFEEMKPEGVVVGPFSTSDQSSSSCWTNQTTTQQNALQGSEVYGKELQRLAEALGQIF